MAEARTTAPNTLRLRLWIVRVLVGLVCVYGFYLALANILIGTGLLEAMINRNPVKTRTHWDRAWTLIPGRAEVRGFSLTGQTVRNQYRLEIDRGDLRVALLELGRLRFHATRLRADGVRYRMRRQLVEGEEAPPGREYEPVIPGMPEYRPPLEQLAPKERRFPWTIDLDDVRAEGVEEVWLTAYRLLGEGSLQGAMEVLVGHDVRVDESVLVIPEARVMTGAIEAARDVEIDLRISLGPMAVRGAEFPDMVAASTGRAQMQARGADFGFLNLFFAKLPWFSLEGEGEVVADVTLVDGEPALESEILFSSEHLAVRMKDLTVGGQSRVSITPIEGQRARLEARLEDLGTMLESRRRRSSGGVDLTVVATSSIANLHDAFSDLEVSLELPETEISELAFFNRYIPDGAPIRFLDGSDAVIEAHAELTESAGGGELKLRARRMGARFNDLPVSGDLDIDLILEAMNPREAEFDISGSVLQIDHVSAHDRGVEIDPEWWLRLELDEAELDFSAPVRVSSAVRLTMRDSLPWVEAFAPADSRNLLRRLLALEDLEARAEILFGTEVFEIAKVALEGRSMESQYLSGDGPTVIATSDRIVLGEGFEGMRLDLALTETVVPEMAVFNSMLPETSGVEFSPGTRGRVKGFLMVGDGRLAGEVQLDSYAGIILCGLELMGDMSVDLLLGSEDLKSGRIDLSGTRLILADVNELAGGSAAQSWGAYFEIEEGTVRLGDRPALEGTVLAWIADTKPLLKGYWPRSRDGLGLEDLLRVNDVRLRTHLVADQRRLVLSNLALSGHGDVGGHLEGPGFSMVGEGLQIDAAEGIEAIDLRVDLPSSKLNNLAAFNRYIPKTSALAFVEASEGSLAAWVDVTDEGIRAQATLGAEGVGVDLGATTLVGDLRALINLQRGDFENRRYELDGSWLTFEESTIADTLRENWWGRFDFLDTHVEIDQTVALESKLFFEMGDSKPLAGLIGSPRNSWLAEILDFREVVGSTRLRIDDETLIVSELEMRGFGQTGEGVLGPGLRIAASGSTIDLNRGLEGLDLVIDLPRSQIRDLTLLNRYLSKDMGLEFLPEGRGWLEAHAELRSAGGSGRFVLGCDDMAAEFLGNRISGDLDFEVDLSDWNLEDQRITLKDAALHLDDVVIQPREGAGHDSWAALITLPEAAVTMGFPISFEGRAEIAMEDSWPFAEWAARSSWIARRFRSWLEVSSINGSMFLSGDRRRLTLDDINLKGDRLAIEGDLSLFDGGMDGLVFMSRRWLDVAVELDGNDRDWKLFRARRWFERRYHEMRVTLADTE